MEAWGYTDYDGSTALMTFVRNNRRQIPRFLLHQVGVQSSQGFSALMYAVTKHVGHSKRQLQQLMAERHLRLPDGQTALDLATP